jgi:pimeloyl-ACP methyl ester carboxylesterase
MFDRNPGAAEAIVDEMVEAIREGIDGVVHEASLYHANWGIDLATITSPTHIWHGLDDRQAAPSWAQNLAGRLPGATLTLVEGGGHFSTLIDHSGEILDWLVQNA